MSASNMPRHTATTSPAAIVGAIIASGQPIPTWLREAAIQPPVGDPSENVDMPLSSSSARVIDTHPVQRLEHAPGSKERLDKGNERASVYSNSTSGMHSTYTPIKYVDVSRSSTEETGSVCRRLANEAGEGIGMIIPARHRRQKSDSSGANTDSYSLPEALAFGASSLEGIAQPLAPPVPPHMNSLYGELGSRGIVVGQARLPQAAVAAVGHAVIGASAPVALPTNSCPSSAHAPDTASEYSILSPLDRLARYHGLDDWMSADARQTSLSPQQRESSESDNTSSIYAARPIRRSADGL
ncbi:hypothetical protein H4S01_003450 [Coemansia sp. RSA 2610]|nr:hypothetical protein H4S01_003450 [Coemansia sp. RSA 2610]